MRITKDNIAIIDNDECISKWVEETGRLDHDPNMLPLALKHINSDSVVIDAGAFIGDHTIAYAKKANKVIAFEPNKDNFKCLEYNLKGFNNVQLMNLGLSDEECSIKMKNVESNTEMSYAEKSSKGVKCITIDSLELEKLDFIKIDCEGYEHNILKGAEKTIKKFKPIMVIEINNHTLSRNCTSDNDIYIYLMELGYEYRNIYPGQSLYEEQLDLLCIPK